MELQSLAKRNAATLKQLLALEQTMKYEFKLLPHILPIRTEKIHGNVGYDAQSTGRESKP
jgi:hypothetical protein